jgi:hypothetical protein
MWPVHRFVYVLQEFFAARAITRLSAHAQLSQLASRVLCRPENDMTRRFALALVSDARLAEIMTATIFLYGGVDLRGDSASIIADATGVVGSAAAAADAAEKTTRQSLDQAASATAVAALAASAIVPVAPLLQEYHYLAECIAELRKDLRSGLTFLARTAEIAHSLFLIIDYAGDHNAVAQITASGVAPFWIVADVITNGKQTERSIRTLKKYRKEIPTNPALQGNGIQAVADRTKWARRVISAIAVLRSIGIPREEGVLQVLRTLLEPLPRPAPLTLMMYAMQAGNISATQADVAAELAAHRLCQEEAAFAGSLLGHTLRASLRDVLFDLAESSGSETTQRLAVHELARRCCSDFAVTQRLVGDAHQREPSLLLRACLRTDSQCDALLSYPVVEAILVSSWMTDGEKAAFAVRMWAGRGRNAAAVTAAAHADEWGPLQVAAASGIFPFVEHTLSQHRDAPFEIPRTRRWRLTAAQIALRFGQHPRTFIAAKALCGISAHDVTSVCSLSDAALSAFGAINGSGCTLILQDLQAQAALDANAELMTAVTAVL